MIFISNTQPTQNDGSQFTCLLGHVKEKFENEGFALKKHQITSVHTSPKEIWKLKSLVIIDLCFSKTRAREISLLPGPFSNDFFVRAKTQSLRFQITPV